MRTSKCSRCGGKRRETHRWCLLCFNAYMRLRRRKGIDTYASLSPEQKRRANARAHLKVYVKRGKVKKPKRCELCGGRGKLHGHHHDYDKPLDVRWLCPPCHRWAHPKP